MSNLQVTTAKELFSSENIRVKFNELLGKRAPAFMTSVLQIVSQNEQLRQADPQSIYHSAAVAATLDLPLNNNLGFAYIVPYYNKGQQIAQFQMGYKGFVQLALRSGQFFTIASTPIYEGQLVSENPLTGFVFDFTKKGGAVIGYASYFKLLNGFEKTLYMSVTELQAHANKYSQTYKKNFGVWKDDFNAMCLKTVIKLLLSKYAPLSVEMQTAIISDQSVDENKYPDNEPEKIDKEEERIKLMLSDCKDLIELQIFQEKNPDIDIALINARKEELENE
jgi:recombination protein RecT